LANILKKNGKRPLLLSLDVHRPAAAKQLEVLAQKVDVPSFIMPEEKDPIVIAKAGIERAKYLLCDTLIVDTAGRMTVDEELMDELIRIGDYVKPHEKLLVVDAMIGQEAVAVAQSFEERIGLDGFIMTKLDGDARGGAALSIRKMTGKPIKYICVGEKIENIEEFYPDRMADRILGMGDVLSLIEKAQQSIDEEEAAKSVERMLSNSFSMEDLLSQFEQIKKLGSMKDVIGMIPGAAGKVKEEDLDDKVIDTNMAIIRSMTKKERRVPNILNASRRRRIASGSGTTVQQVNQLIRQYEQTSEMMKKFSKMTKGKKGLGKMPGMGKGGFPGMGNPFGKGKFPF
ncbi:MAG TPA: signal recognition particle protein, partial [Clostridiales bacterium]|nr:signal recognition particle protein [Clostridiales bacterium]